MHLPASKAFKLLMQKFHPNQNLVMHEEKFHQLRGKMLMSI